MPNRNVCHFVPDKVVSVPLGQNKTGQASNVAGQKWVSFPVPIPSALVSLQASWSPWGLKLLRTPELPVACTGTSATSEDENPKDCHLHQQGRKFLTCSAVS